MSRTWLPALLLLLPACGAPPTPPERIVLVVVDTLRRDHVGAYGASQPTPNIDRLADGGTVFRNAVSSFHSTPTSMGALFTGHTPSLEADGEGRALPWNERSWCGLARFAAADEKACIPAAVPTLAERLHELGYRTLAVHSHPLLRRPSGFERGFERWVEVRGGNLQLAFDRQASPRFAQGRAAAAVNAAVSDLLDARPGDRFFLYVHYLDAHDWALARTSYAEAVLAADAAVGALFDMLSRRGLLEDTAIVLTSDHGESLSEMHWRRPRPQHAGNPSFEPVLRVPLLVWGAKLAPTDRLMRSEDVFRLLVGLAGGETRGSELAADEQLVTEQTYRTYRSGRWKSFWPRTGGAPVLVDLATDPAERNDLAGERPETLEAHRSRVQALVARLKRDRELPAAVDPVQRENLRALGYLEPAYDLDALETSR